MFVIIPFDPFMTGISSEVIEHLTSWNFFSFRVWHCFLMLYQFIAFIFCSWSMYTCWLHSDGKDFLRISLSIKMSLFVSFGTAVILAANLESCVIVHLVGLMALISLVVSGRRCEAGYVILVWKGSSDLVFCLWAWPKTTRSWRFTLTTILG